MPRMPAARGPADSGSVRLTGEILVADDGSSDGLCEIAAAEGGKWCRENTLGNQPHDVATVMRDQIRNSRCRGQRA